MIRVSLFCIGIGCLAVPGEARAGLLDGDLLAAEGLGRLDVRAHELFDAREVLL